jgi:hypothetical protein
LFVYMGMDTSHRGLARTRLSRLGSALGALALACSGLLSQPAAAQEALWVDADAHPTAELRWKDASGRAVVSTKTVAYSEPDHSVNLIGNIQVYASIGGTRLLVGAGHPSGVIVRVGLRKAQDALPMFASIDPDEPIELVLRGIRFKADAIPLPESIVQHLGFALDDVQACGLGPEYVDMFNLASEDDTLNSKIDDTRGRFGILRTDPREMPRQASEAGFTSVMIEADGSVTLRTRFPYRLLRHQRDPSSLELPGTFFEPAGFHVEFEAVPPEVALREFGVTRDEVVATQPRVSR